MNSCEWHAFANLPRAGDGDRRVEGEKRRRPVASRIRVREAARHGAAVAHLHVRGEVRGVGHERQVLADERRGRDLGMPAERADHETIAVAPES